MKIFFYLTLFIAFQSFSQTEIRYATMIDSARIRKHVEVLAHDSLEGRNTGEAGQKKAAKYLQEEFRRLGMDSLTKGYYQPFYLSNKIDEGSLIINRTKLTFLADFGSMNQINLIVFKGSGVKHYTYSDFVRLKIKQETAVLISVDSPKEIDMELIKSSGIRTVFILSKQFDAKIFEKSAERKSTAKELEQNIIYVNANKILKIKSKNKIHLDLNLKNPCNTTENVIAYLPGSDPVLKNEYIVISAHYDHLGIKKGKVYNGADDNASGTSALLELARVFKEAQKKGENPKRSVLFICFTGEEHGLLGSEYYSLNPLVPMDKTVADFNIDMIGHKDPATEQSQFSVFVIGSDKISMDFHKMHEATAKKYSTLKLDYTYNDPSNKERLYYRSDHYNFAKNGIPSIFYFGGFHDDYHEATDDIEKLNFTKIKTISELVFYTAWIFAN